MGNDFDYYEFHESKESLMESFPGEFKACRDYARRHRDDEPDEDIGPMDVCEMCGASVPESEMTRIGGVWICLDCKTKYEKEIRHIEEMSK